MNLKEAYIWLDVIKEKFPDDLVEQEIEALKLCQAMIIERMTGYADERMNI